MNLKKALTKDRRIVLENFFSLSTLQGINYLLPLVILPYLIRKIGPGKFGLIAFAQAFIQYFMIITDYGFSLSATRNIALHKEHKEKISAIFSSVMTVKTILSALSFIILLAVIKFIPKFRQDYPVYLLSFGAVVGNTMFPVWFFQGQEKMKYITIINVIGGIIYTTCIFVFVRKPSDYLLVPMLNSLFFIITGCLGLYIAFSRFGLEFVAQSYAEIKQELKTGWSIFSSVIAVNAYTTTRIFAVGLLTNNVLTGYYSIAERIANFVQTFPLDSFSQAIYPRLNKIFAKNKKRAFRIMRKVQRSSTITSLISLPIVFYLSPWIVRVVCGKTFVETIASLEYLLVAVFFVVAKAFKVQFLLICGRQDIYSKLHVATALVGLPTIFLLIFAYSYLGAAISTIILEGAIFFATNYVIRDLNRKNHWWGRS